MISTSFHTSRLCLRLLGVMLVLAYQGTVIGVHAAEALPKRLPFLPPELIVTLNPALGTNALKPSNVHESVTLEEALTESSEASSTAQKTHQDTSLQAPTAKLNQQLTTQNKQAQASNLGWKQWIDASQKQQEVSEDAAKGLSSDAPVYLEADLQLLWRETLIKNPVVRFCVGNLTSPASLNAKRSSLFVAKTLNTLIQGASVGTLFLPGGSLYRDMTIATVGQALSNLATNKLTPTQEARMLSQTELIQLAQVVDTLKLRLTDHYLALRHSLTQLERLEAQANALQHQYERAKKEGNTALAMMLGMTYHQTALKRLEAQEKFLASQQVLERLAGQGVVSRLALITGHLPQEVSGKTLAQSEQEILKPSEKKTKTAPIKHVGEGVSTSPLQQVLLTPKEQALKTQHTSPEKPKTPDTAAKVDTSLSTQSTKASPTPKAQVHRHQGKASGGGLMTSSSPSSSSSSSSSTSKVTATPKQKKNKVKSAKAMLEALDALTPPELPHALSQDDKTAQESHPSSYASESSSLTEIPHFRKRLWQK